MKTENKNRGNGSSSSIGIVFMDVIRVDRVSVFIHFSAASRNGRKKWAVGWFRKPLWWTSNGSRMCCGCDAHLSSWCCSRFLPSSRWCSESSLNLRWIFAGSSLLKWRNETKHKKNQFFNIKTCSQLIWWLLTILPYFLDNSCFSVDSVHRDKSSNWRFYFFIWVGEFWLVLALVNFQLVLDSRKWRHHRFHMKPTDPH